MAGKFTADDIFEACRFDMIRDTVFLNRDQCVEAKCGMNELADLCMEVFPTWLGINTIDQGMEMLSKAKNPAARHYIRLMQTAIDNAKWTDRYYSSARVIKKNPAPVMEGRNRKMKRVKESVEDAIRDALQSGDYSMSEISTILDNVTAQIEDGYLGEDTYNDIEQAIYDAMTTDGYSYEDIQDCISVANAALMEAYDAFKVQRRKLQRKMDENLTRRRRRLD